MRKIETKKRQIVAIFFAVVMTLSLCACGETTPSEEKKTTTIFTDSLGREVTVPNNITKVAISGPLAQKYVFALCPDLLVGVATKWWTEATGRISEKYLNLPVLGQLYGGKGEINVETLLATGAEVVIDIGEPKATAKEDLDALQQQCGIPFVHITASLETAGDVYRSLGKLLNMETEAKAYADYCDSTYAKVKAVADKVTKEKVLYCLGDDGHNVIAKGSYHGGVLDLLTDNLAVVDNPSSKGTGNEVDMEQILKWNPDVIIFAPDSVYDTATSDSTWQGINAIKTGRVYKAPSDVDNWMGFPPSIQQYLGLLWLAKTLYPTEATYDLESEVIQYYKLFYHCELTSDQCKALIG